jgi:hypothetical protein
MENGRLIGPKLLAFFFNEKHEIDFDNLKILDLASNDDNASYRQTVFSFEKRPPLSILWWVKHGLVPLVAKL